MKTSRKATTLQGIAIGAVLLALLIGGPVIAHAADAQQSGSQAQPNVGNKAGTHIGLQEPVNSTVTPPVANSTVTPPVTNSTVVPPVTNSTVASPVTNSTVLPPGTYTGDEGHVFAAEQAAQAQSSNSDLGDQTGQTGDQSQANNADQAQYHDGTYLD